MLLLLLPHQAPLLVQQGLLRSMEAALWRDTSFLAGLGVMDYSLLVGEWLARNLFRYVNCHLSVALLVAASGVYAVWLAWA